MKNKSDSHLLTPKSAYSKRKNSVKLFEAAKQFETKLSVLNLPTSIILKNAKLKVRVDQEKELATLPGFIDE